MEERPILFNLLHKDELEYEVRVRQGTPATTVADLRAQIRKLNIDVPTDEVAEFDGDTTVELDAIAVKLAELDHLLQESAADRGSVKILNRVQAVAHHLFHRITRIKPSVAESKLYAELFDKLQKLLYKLDTILVNFRSALTTEPTVEPNLPTSCRCGRHSSVHKLNLHYDGNTCVKTFLRRLEQLRVSRGISESDLLCSACELFTDGAASWFDGLDVAASSWSELKQWLRFEYLPADFDERLLDEIRARTQGSEESITNYLNIMQCYFARLDRTLPECDKLYIVMRNIRPYYSKQLSLLAITTLSELKAKCRLLEAASQRAKTFLEPTTDTKGLLAPDLVYKPAARKANVHAVIPPANFCVRCRVNGHTLKECKAPYKLICYRCGESNVTARTCPKCLPIHESKN